MARSGIHQNEQPIAGNERKPDLNHLADQEMARRSFRVAFTLVPVTIIVMLMTDLRTEALLPSLGVVLLYVLSGITRTALARSFDRIYHYNPRRWLRLFTAVTLFPALVWGLCNSWVLFHFGLEWTYYICLLTSVGITASATSSLSSRMNIFRSHIVLILLPHAVTLLLVGHGQQLALSGLIIVFGTQAHVLGAYFHREFWTRLRKEKELEQRAQALLEAHAEVKAANLAKSNFLANMSHEIRTPMNGVLGLTSLVLDTKLSTTQREYLNDIKISGDALLQIINEILDFSKIEAGKFNLEPANFQLADTVQNVIKPLQFAAAARNNRLITELDSQLPESVVGDNLRLWQVLTNLTGNAIKFTKNGTITLRVNVAGHHEGKPQIRFIVQDTGIGIPLDNQTNIFQAFQQADGSTTRRFGGTGLGLTISARIIRMMGGSINLTSTVGEGSSFFFTVPLGVGDLSPVQRPAEVPPTDLPLTGTRLLVVEDNLVNAKLATRILNKSGAEVEWAKNGELGVKAWSEGSFDAVLMDVQMPVMDGFTATTEIRARETDGEHIPIIALTAHALDGYREKCLAAGMDDFLTKPLNAKILRDTVAQWTRQPVA